MPSAMMRALRNPFLLVADHLSSRDVAQPGSALAWGARGRRFKSSRPDQILSFATFLSDLAERKVDDQYD